MPDTNNNLDENSNFLSYRWVKTIIAYLSNLFAPTIPDEIESKSKNELSAEDSKVKSRNESTIKQLESKRLRFTRTPSPDPYNADDEKDSLPTKPRNRTPAPSPSN
jgi:hypothetical protein